MWAGLLLARSRMKRLDGEPPALPVPPPLVTIVIPAKDEGAGIAQCVGRVLGQDYPAFDVVAIDDRSTDETGPALDALAAGDARLRALHVAAGALPQGWLGKCHALHVATRGLSSDWLLFVDSDVILEPAALRHVLGVALQRGYDAVSILPKLDCRGFVPRLVLPIAAAAWAIMNQVSLTNDDSRPDNAAANGQFFLIRRDRYEAVGNHAAVRDQITEDVELMRLLKARGCKVRLLFGQKLASTHMHTHWRQMLHGWGRIYSGTARRKPGRILAAMAFIVFCGLRFYMAILHVIVHHAFTPGWIGVVTAQGVLMFAFLAKIYRSSGNRARYAWLFPVTAVYLLVFMAYALRLCRTGRYSWRGSEFAAG